MNVITAEANVTLREVSGYVEGSDSTTTSPEISVMLWSRVGAGAWGHATSLGTVTLVNGRDTFYPTATLNTPLARFTTYAIGYCSYDEVNYYYNNSTSSIADPSWGTMDGYSTYPISSSTPATSLSNGRGVYMTITVEASDSDGDGFDALDDCDDADGDVNPDATEVWYDGADADCDGGNDYDQDGDGHEVESHGGDDCDDTNAFAYPGAPGDTWYDGVDGNCDGSNDFDQDRDGEDYDAYGGTDCDDQDPTINTSATESWYDGIDEDCDGRSDFDQDQDGHDAQSAGGDDCDDTDASLTTDCSGTGGDDTGDGSGDDTAANGDGNGGGKGGCGGGAAGVLFLGAVFAGWGRRRG